MRFASDESVIFNLQPSHKLIYIWLFSKCLVHGIAAGFLSYAAAYFYIGFSAIKGDPRIKIIFSIDAVLITIAIGTIGWLLSFLYHRLVLRTVSYVITDKRCIYSGGILRKVTHSAPYSKITDVETSKNIIEQILGISTISLFTPGTASVNPRNYRRPIPELFFQGLVDAEDVAQHITERLNQNRPTLL